MTANLAREITKRARAKNTWVNFAYEKLQQDIELAASAGAESIATVLDASLAETAEVECVADMLIGDGFKLEYSSQKNPHEVLFKVSW